MKQFERPSVTAGLCLAGTLLISACQPSEDPAEAGFIDGLVNMFGGTYDERLEARQEQRQSLEDGNQTLTGEIASLEARRDANEAQIDVARKKLDQATLDVNRLRAHYEADSVKWQTELAQLAAIQKEIDSEQLRLASAGGEPDVAGDIAADSIRKATELSLIIEALPE